MIAGGGLRMGSNVIADLPTIGAVELLVQGTNQATSDIAQLKAVNTTNSPIYYFVKSRGSGANDYVSVQNGDSLGRIQFSGTDGANVVGAAYILATVAGTPAGGNVQGDITFFTGSNVGASYTRTLTLNYDGQALFNNSLGSNIFPSIGGYTDPDTGIYWPSAGAMAFVSNGLEAFRINNSQQLLANGGLGFGTGAAGSVTQTTSKSTNVTLNTVSGVVISSTASLNAGTGVTFTLLNSKIANTDTLITNVRSPTGKYRVYVTGMTAGYANIEIVNSTAGSLSEAVVINFNLLKGVNA